MSHSIERKEKICLNCRAELYGRYCHQCGQENIAPKESVWGLIHHFFSDITHFDGKFFVTAKYLISRPGFLAREYISGRRANYLHPIRMYVFSSAIFFLILYSFLNVKDMKINDKEKKVEKKAVENMSVLKDSMLRSARTREDSLAINRTLAVAEKTIGIGDNVTQDTATVTILGTRRNTTIQQYDSLQKTLPPGDRDGWFTRMINHRFIEINAKYRKDKSEFFHELVEKFIHSLPSLLFVSLPLYALFLKLLYWRRGFYYVDHVMFLIYLYIYTFLVLLIYFPLMKLNDSHHSGWIDLLECMLFGYGVYYAWRAMHKFYGQGKGKTFAKFVLFNIATTISVTMLFVLFLIIVVFRI